MSANENTEWAVRYPDGEVELAGILGENRARMLAGKFGGEAFEVPAGISLGEVRSATPCRRCRNSIDLFARGLCWDCYRGLARIGQLPRA